MARKPPVLLDRFAQEPIVCRGIWDTRIPEIPNMQIHTVI